MKNNVIEIRKKMQELLENNPEEFLDKAKKGYSNLMEIYLHREKRTDETISRANIYCQTLGYLKIPENSKYDDIKKLIVVSRHTLKLIRNQTDEINPDSLEGNLQSVSDPLGVEEEVLSSGSGYNKEHIHINKDGIKVESSLTIDDSSFDKKSLEKMVDSLNKLGFEDAESIYFTGFTIEKIIRYGSRFNEIAEELIKNNSGELKIENTEELEKKIKKLFYEVNNDTFYGEVNYGNESISYHELFPRITEFLKREITNIKSCSGVDNNIDVKFSKALKKIGLENEFEVIEASDCAKDMLVGYYEIIEKIINPLGLEGIALWHLYKEDIPTIQNFAMNDKISGEVKYHNKIVKINDFIYGFGEELKEKLKNIIHNPLIKEKSKGGNVR